MIKIIADERIPFLKGVLEPFAGIDYLPASEIKSSTIKDCDCLIIRTRTKCNGNLLKGSGVKFIATATIGYEHIDTAYCHQAGIEWANAPGCNAGSVNQYLAAALAFYSIQKGWLLKGKRIGIIGVGHVGSQVARTAQYMGMVPLLNDPPREESEGKGSFVDINLLLAESDIISLHAPLTFTGKHKTLHLAGKEFFSKLTKPMLFINTARGPVCDTSALLAAIDEGIVNDAILDVWENEPDLSLGLLEKSYIGTPHIAGYSVDGKANGTAMAVRAVSRHFNLGLDDWYPGKLPSPDTDLIDVHGEHSPEALLKQSILQTYNIADDSRRLKQSPTDFEYFRDHYPVRREFNYYKVNYTSSGTRLENQLSGLGFMTQPI